VPVPLVPMTRPEASLICTAGLAQGPSKKPLIRL